MKIVHICLACFYVDKMAYQENLLTKHHAKHHDVTILTSDFAFDASGNRIKKDKKEYVNEFGIPVIVLDRSRRYGPYSRYNDFDGVYEHLCELSPDVIFCHGGQFVALKDVIRYCKQHPTVSLYIDQHGDYYNTPVTSMKSGIVHKYIYGHWMRKAIPYVTKFWGVTPWRCQYLNEVYGIPKDKIDLLIMGGDDDKIHLEHKDEIRRTVREKFAIDEHDFVIVTGGKIDKNKQFHLLIEAVKQLRLPHVKLMIFGQPSDEYKEEFHSLIDGCDAVRYIGWVASQDVYDYFLASDLCAFPGTHSVLWEQACACGLPGLFKSWDGMHHVDVGGNAVFLTQDSADEIRNCLAKVVSNQDEYTRMAQVADQGKSFFSYKCIAEKAIGGESVC